MSASFIPFSMPFVSADIATRLDTPRMMPSIVSNERNLFARISSSPTATALNQFIGLRIADCGLRIGASAHSHAPTAQPIPAWGIAPSHWTKMRRGLKARSIPMRHGNGAGFEPLVFSRGENLGRCPRLVCIRAFGTADKSRCVRLCVSSKAFSSHEFGPDFSAFDCVPLSAFTTNFGPSC